MPKYAKHNLFIAVTSLALAVPLQGAFAQAAHAVTPRTTIASSTQSKTAASRVWYRPGEYPQISLPDGSRETVRSALNIPGPMHFGSFVWNEDRIPDGPVWIRIDLSHQLLSVFRAGHEIGTTVIVYGSDGKPTPIGAFHILQKSAHYYSHTYDAPMPFALRLTNDGVAIHGSDVRAGWATHGCIGVPLEFARLLFSASEKGTTVVILPPQENPKKPA
jgi:hypothetical protein